MFVILTLKWHNKSMENALHVGLSILYIVMLFGGLCYLPRLFFMFYGFKKQKELPDSPKTNRYTILIPARNESRVIEGLLKSIKNQTYPQELIDTYVMVTSSEDPTIEICKRYNVKKVVVVPPNLNSKGKTLDICLKEIMKENPDYYQAHFIIDADNVLADNFIEKMNNVYNQGYKISMGRRTNKSWNDGLVSNSSFLTFTYVNTLNNKFRTRFGSNITISGSGFYVANDLVKGWGGWPFHSITEDYEITKWSILNDIKGYYCEAALIADEQLTKMKPSKTQRLRWIKGHNEIDSRDNGKLMKQIFTPGTKNLFFKLDYMFSLVPVLFMLVGLAAFFLYSGVIMIISLCMASQVWLIALSYMLKTFFALYGILLLHTSLGLIGDRDIIKLSFWKKVALFFYYPYFMWSWVPVYAKSFFVKKVVWTQTEHKLTKEVEVTKK